VRARPTEAAFKLDQKILRVEMLIAKRYLEYELIDPDKIEDFLQPIPTATEPIMNRRQRAINSSCNGEILGNACSPRPGTSVVAALRQAKKKK